MPRPASRARPAGGGALVAALLLLLTAAPAPAQDSAVVRGRVVLGLEGVRLADLGPIVVYLEPVAGAAPPTRRAAPTIRQRYAQFRPGFLAIAVGQSVRMPNDDDVDHNVFSYSKGNEFDLGLYPAGESRSVSFRKPGLVRIYCSIHESMNGTLFVAPSPYFSRASDSGSFLIAGVPPGRYRLRTWCERLPETTRELELAPGQSLELELPLAGSEGGP
jgi:plastocyanin